MPMFDLPREALLRYRGSGDRPAGFAEFWSTALNELESVPADTEVAPADFPVRFAECSHLWFTGTGGARVHARLWRPAVIEEPTPLVVMFHGLGGRAPDWTVPLGYVAAGFTVAALDCRGQAGLSEDLGGVTGGTHSWYLLRGVMDDPANAYYRHVYLDTARLVDVALGLPDVDRSRVCVTGGSQGGALTVVAAALNQAVTHVAPVFPYLSDFRRVWELELAKGAYGDIEYWFRNVDPLHRREDELFEKLALFDVSLLAEDIRGEVLMTVTHVDRICPPSTQFAIYNRIGTQKSLREYYDYGHERLPENDDAIFQFFTAR